MTRLRFVLPLLAALIVGCSGDGDKPADNGDKPAGGGKVDSSKWPWHAAKAENPSAAYQWLEIILETSARRVDKVGAKPTIISREMVISCTGMFDAWACYDEKAVGTRLGGKLRRPAAERTEANKVKAIGYAVLRCLEDVYSEDVAWIDETAKT
ncbi:MAG: hypothetical protein K8T20_09155, partial [Planctomycetes bacterium]|nr:hypothetical protein [Planctomycetota bacterium]